MERAAAFYDALGWQRVDGPDGVIAYDLIGQTLGLYPLDKLAEDIGLPIADLGQGAITLAHNLSSRAEVDTLVARAQDAGATVIKPPQEVFWGGYHAYLRAPDGAIWEIAHNPYAPLSPDGAFRWNGY
jgi:catechol 2,3-dioxygenase-like lactoylglutathione lyase family enzyme